VKTFAVKYTLYVRVVTTDADDAFAKAEAIILEAQGASPERLGILDLLEYDEIIEQEEALP